MRTISTVGNYDYLFDYNFHLDGTIEIRLSASGYVFNVNILDLLAYDIAFDRYLQGAWFDDPQMDYGTKIRKTFSELFRPACLAYHKVH